jgi:hypothetical protein
MGKMWKSNGFAPCASCRFVGNIKVFSTALLLAAVRAQNNSKEPIELSIALK